MELQEKISELLEYLESGLVERETPVRLALLAALSGEHLLLIGPPGTAKSEIAGRLHRVFSDSSYFERLLTRFSVPEELFGPLSLEALEEDRYERKIEGYLPTATVAFVDEIFKANSAILNALLTLINEREFDNGNERIDVPLRCLIGASNELPEGNELDALYDRFLLRYRVEPVGADNFEALMDGGEPSMPEVPDKLELSQEDLREVRNLSREVVVPEGVIEMLGELRGYLREQEIFVSDRRWMQARDLLKTAAYTNGRDEVSVFDGWLLQHCLWNTPAQRPIIHDWYRERVGADSVSEPGNFARTVEALDAMLENDRAKKSQARNDDGEPLYHAEDSGTTTSTDKYPKTNAQGESLYLAPPGTKERRNGQEFTRRELQDEFSCSYRGKIEANRTRYTLSNYVEDEDNVVMVEPDPFLEPMSYSSGHVEGRLQRVDGAIEDLEGHLAGVESQISEIEQHVLEDHWLPEEFAAEAGHRLEEKKESAEGLLERLLNIREGFEELPIEEGIDA